MLIRLEDDSSGKNDGEELLVLQINDNDLKKLAEKDDTDAPEFVFLRLLEKHILPLIGSIGMWDPDEDDDSIDDDETWTRIFKG